MERSHVAHHLTHWSRVSILLFTALAVTVAIVAVALNIGWYSGSESKVIWYALTLDIVFIVPGVYLFTIRRWRQWPKASILPIWLASIGVAWLIIPEPDQGLLDWIKLLLIPLELCIFTLIVIKAVRIAGANKQYLVERNDIFKSILQATRDHIPYPAVAEILSYEIALPVYAFARKRPETAARNPFSAHKRAGYGSILVGLLIAMFVELFAMHLLLTYLELRTLAWLLTLLSLYGVLWIVGDFRAIQWRTTTIHEDRLEFRLGLRWNADIPFEQIERLIPATKPVNRESGYLNASIIGDPDYLLELRAPIVCKGYYGFKKKVTRLGFRMDDRDAFEEGLTQAFQQWKVLQQS
ncbi:MAG: hypothetical protein HKN43_15085 [Rhodothermales bacterium]|nr:hypothetical protein [Rhodothermales bacterium]